MSNLQKMRKAKNMSQSQLAAASGVPLRMIQYYEQGARDINKAGVTTALKLADALECNVKEILNETY